MDFSGLWAKGLVRQLTQGEAGEVLALYRSNAPYFAHCPPAPSKASVLQDMRARPDGLPPEHKHFLGCYQGHRLAAVLDLLEGFPEPGVLWIGLLMVDAAWQGKGLGSALVDRLAALAKAQGFSALRLACAKGNRQAQRFWQQHGFAPTGAESPQDGYTALPMARQL